MVLQHLHSWLPIQRHRWRTGSFARPAIIGVVLAILVWALSDGRNLEAASAPLSKRAIHAGADLRGADLQEADLQGANLQEAQLQGANLQGASLQGANLQEANFEGADLWQTFFWQANLQGAQLQGVDLSGAIGLRLQQIELAVTDEKTRLPEYLRPPGKERSTAP